MSSPWGRRWPILDGDCRALLVLPPDSAVGGCGPRPRCRLYSFLASARSTQLPQPALGADGQPPLPLIGCLFLLLPLSDSLRGLPDPTGTLRGFCESTHTYLLRAPCRLLAPSLAPWDLLAPLPQVCEEVLRGTACRRMVPGRGAVPGDPVLWHHFEV